MECELGHVFELGLFISLVNIQLKCLLFLSMCKMKLETLELNQRLETAIVALTN